jgi:hypothetical protein
LIHSRHCAPGTPVEIRRQLVAIDVVHLGFTGAEASGVIIVSRSVRDDVARFFAHALRLRFPIEKVVPADKYAWDDKAMMADNNSSGFNYRLVAGASLRSLHSAGTAFDINPRLNPYVRYPPCASTIVQPPGATLRPEVAGTLHADHPLVVLMRDLGWEWGGDWLPESGRVDYQHFQMTSDGIG